MPSITLTLPTAGTQITAGLHSANYAALQTLLNGGLDNTNVLAAAGIVGSKLQASRVATTVAGLGAAADGALGLIRVGASPYSHMHLIYDATYAKWVSPQFTLFQTEDPSGANSGNMAFPAVISTYRFGNASVIDAYALNQAGLVFQSRMAGRFTAGGAMTMTVACETFSSSDEGTWSGTTGKTYFAPVFGAASGKTKISNWVTHDADNYGQPKMQVRFAVSSSAAFAMNVECSAYGRWVSA